MTESYGVLTVGSVVSGTVAVGQRVTGAGVLLPITAIDANISGSGNGSTWLVNNAQTVGGPGGESMTMLATPLVVNYNSLGERNFFEIQPNGQFGYDYNQSTLRLRQRPPRTDGPDASVASPRSSTGGAARSATAYMNNLVQGESTPVRSVPGDVANAGAVGPEYSARSRGGRSRRKSLYLLESSRLKPPRQQQDRARRRRIHQAHTTARRSAAGALAAPGTYIPVTGATSAAAEIEDAAGSYSLAGASAPTLAQPGYYVPTAGATSETPDDPGY